MPERRALDAEPDAEPGAEQYEGKPPLARPFARDEHCNGRQFRNEQQQPERRGTQDQRPLWIGKPRDEAEQAVQLGRRCQVQRPEMAIPPQRRERIATEREGEDGRCDRAEAGSDANHPGDRPRNAGQPREEQGGQGGHAHLGLAGEGESRDQACRERMRLAGSLARNQEEGAEPEGERLDDTGVVRQHEMPGARSKQREAEQEEQQGEVGEDREASAPALQQKPRRHDRGDPVRKQVPEAREPERTARQREQVGRQRSVHEVDVPVEELTVSEAVGEGPGEAGVADRTEPPTAGPDSCGRGDGNEEELRKAIGSAERRDERAQARGRVRRRCGVQRVRR